MDDASPQTSPRTRFRSLAPAHMPRDYVISLDALRQGGTDAFLADLSRHAVRQPMDGFDERYVNVVDYIVRITHRIWEEKDVGAIYDTYSHDCAVWDDFGLSMGRDRVVEHTIGSLAAFPDMRILAEEVIWAGDARVGLHASHRSHIAGVNSGFTRFAAPTGRRIQICCIANSVARDNEIFEEHLIYDHTLLLTQLGLDPLEAARRVAAEGRAPRLPDDFLAGEQARVPGQGKPELRAIPDAPDESPEAFVRAGLHMIWNRRSLAAMERVYHPGVRVQATGGRIFDGIGQLRSFVLSLLATFPDAAHAIDDLYWMGNPEEGFLVAIRWSLRGSHRGWGRYGAPTGREIGLWGITHWVIEGGRVTREWTMFNEFGVLLQIAGSGATEAAPPLGHGLAQQPGASPSGAPDGEAASNEGRGS